MAGWDERDLGEARMERVVIERELTDRRVNDCPNLKLDPAMARVGRERMNEADVREVVSERRFRCFQRLISQPDGAGLRS
jgi:hypothetical protein